jgi:hypothetical protein
MAYTLDLASSARRHRTAAERLDDTAVPVHHRRRDVAGYLYGVSGECALKQLMREAGIYPSGPRRDDPFYAHFPALKRMLAERIQGRRMERLRRFAEDPSLMQHWDTDMRYAPGKDIDPGWVDRWRDDCRRLVDAMEIG